MNELIAINNDNQTVSARDLYELLSQEGGVKGTERFSKWFQRFSSYGFEEGIDYSAPNKKVRVQIEGNRAVQREVEDYDLSIDMAKQICMLQRTSKGREIRQYLIDVEKAWNTPEQIMARALKVADQTIKTLEIEIEGKTKLIEELTPKASYYDIILECPDLLTTTEIASDYGMSAVTFNNLLHALGIQFKQSKRWFLYSKYEGNGYAKSKTKQFKHSDGSIGTKTHMYWTQKGRLFLYEFLKGKGTLPMMEREI